MSYSIYTNEQYVGPAASVSDWGRFLDWAETLSVEDHHEIVHLAEHSYVGKIRKLGKQLQAAVSDDLVPSSLMPVVKRLIKAAGSKLSDKQSESILWITDGANGLITELNLSDAGGSPEPE